METNKLNELFVTYDIAKELKGKEYSEPCMAHYLKNDFYLKSFNKQSDNITLRPSYQQVLDWFDDVHKIRIDLTHASSNGGYTYTIWKWNFDNVVGKWQRIHEPVSFTNRNERNIKAVKEAIKLI